MGVQVYFKLKDTSDDYINGMNDKLASLDMDGDYGFVSTQSNQSWLDDINNNPESPQAHLKPEDGLFTMASLLSTFPAWTVVGQMDVDVGFDRTSEADMKQLLSFVDYHHLEFKDVPGIDDLVERSITGEQYEHLLYLNTESAEVTYLLPEEMQNKTLDSSGVLLSHHGSSKNPLYTTILANVEKPVFAKAASQYIDSEMNDIATDRDGHPVILMPLLPLDNKISERLYSLYESLWNLGVRESFDSFLMQQYGHLFEVKNLELNNVDEAERAMNMMGSRLMHHQKNSDGEPKINSIRNESLRNNIMLTLAYIEANNEPSQSPRR